MPHGRLTQTAILLIDWRRPELKNAPVDLAGAFLLPRSDERNQIMLLLGSTRTNEIAFADFNTVMAQNIVGRSDVEKEMLQTVVQ